MMRLIALSLALALIPSVAGAQERTGSWCIGVGIQRCWHDPAPPKKVTIVGCGKIEQRPPEFLKQAHAELDTLPPGSALEAIVGSWIKYRDQARECEKRRKGWTVKAK